MGVIGIIANPESGKDIRRLVSNATVYDNNQKTNILLRALIAIKELGEHTVYFMPDRFNFGHRVIEKMRMLSESCEYIKVFDMKCLESAKDTTEFAKKMRLMKADVVIVLGGDGTSRAAAKEIGDIPMISVSTGTNNVFPSMEEGTVIGMAAAAIASKRSFEKNALIETKRIEIYKNNIMEDIALIDACISNIMFSGAKAIWNVEEISDVIVTKAHPASIGFSSLIGMNQIVDDYDNFGLSAMVSKDLPNCIVPFSAGIFEKINISNITRRLIDSSFSLVMDNRGIIALDGEREVMFNKNEEITFNITRKGPKKVDLRKVLENAQKKGFFHI